MKWVLTWVNIKLKTSCTRHLKSPTVQQQIKWVTFFKNCSVATPGKQHDRKSIERGTFGNLYQRKKCDQHYQQTILYSLPSPQALRFAHVGRGQRRARNSSAWWQSARDHGRGKEKRQSVFEKRLACFIPPAFLCAQIYIKPLTSGNKAAFTAISVTSSGSLCDETLEQCG